MMQLFAHLQRNYVPVQVQSEPVSMYATQDDTQQTVSLLFINKSDSTQQAQVSAAGGFPQVNPWPALRINLNAYSVVVVTLHRGAGAEAYSYTTAGNGHATLALIHTVCGNQGNILDNSLPC